MKYLLGCFFLLFSVQSYAYEIVVEKQDFKKFSTMKACITWLDEKFPNYKWHQRGAAWDLGEDTPTKVQGTTYKILNPKTTKAVSITCEYKQTGTEGSFFDGRYAVLR